MHLQLELVRPELLADRRAEVVPAERTVGLPIRLELVRCLTHDVQRRRGHPAVQRHPVQLEVGDASIDPQVRSRAVEAWEVVLGRLGEVLLRAWRVRRWNWHRLRADLKRVDVAAARTERKQGRSVVGEVNLRPVHAGSDVLVHRRGG